MISIAESYSANLASKTLVKDEFETISEYQARLAKQTSNGGASNKDKFNDALHIIKKAYETQIQPLLHQMQEISNKVQAT